MDYEPLFLAMQKHVALTDADKEKIIARSAIKKLRKHQYLLQEGNVANIDSFVIKGCLRSYEVNEKGQERVIQFSVEDWWVGDLPSFLTDQPSTINIDCLEDCELIQFTRVDLFALFDEVPAWERYFRILLQNAYIATTQRLLTSISKTAMEQYEAFIKKYPHIEQRITNKQIASYLGIAPESLSRIRKQYVSKGNS